MSTVSVSLDGMERSHDLLRGKNGAWRSAIRGLYALLKTGFQPQVTTVVHQKNINDLKPLYTMLCDMGICNWRPINVEPIGRACESHDLLLSSEQFASLLSFIREKRFDSECNMEVTFGCSHYLGSRMSEWFEIIISYAEREFSPPACEATVIFVPAWILKTEKSLCRGISEQMILWKYGSMVFTFSDETERPIAPNG